MRKHLVRISLLCTAFAGLGQIKAASTTPVGFFKVKLPTGTVVSPSQTSLHLALQEQPFVPVGRARGVITGVTNRSISSSDAGWEPGALSQKESPYFLRIVTGAAAGTLCQISTSAADSNTASEVYLLNRGTDLDTMGIVEGQDSYEIVPSKTLNTLFGSETFLAGSTPDSADNVHIWNGAAWIIYYYNSDRNRWERAAAPVADHGNTVVRPDIGMVLVRRGPAITITVEGQLPPSGQRLRYTNSGTSYLGGFPITQTLGDARIQEQPGWISSSSPAQADQIQIWNGAAWIAYYFDPAIAAPQWRRVSFNFPSDHVDIFAPGRPIMIVKRGVAEGGSFLFQPTPY